MSTSTIGLARRAAAIAALPVLIAVILVVVRMLATHPAALTLALIAIGLIALGGWWFFTEPGVLRTLAPLVSIAGVALLVVAMARAFSDAENVIVRSMLVLGVLVGAIFLARYAVTTPPSILDVGRHRREPPQRPVLLCNPWSGGGKVEKFGLVELAGELGVEVVLLDHGLDLEQLTRDAVARGADCLGMAGGDGSQALVASVAAEHDLPFVCIPAGTRNHFALDLGLDRDDPRTAMYAFKDAFERRVDFATVNDRLFVNNVSLGIYATIVQSDEYRDAKVDVSRSMAVELLGRQSEPFDLQYTTPDGRAIDGSFLIMVSNNRYVLGAKRDVSQRRELDDGVLGVFAASPRTGPQAARLLTLAALGVRDVSKYWWEFTTTEFEVRSKSGTAYMGVDGEALEAETPLRFRIHPQGLRMYVPNGNIESAELRRSRHLRFGDLVSVALGKEPQRGGGA